MLTGGKGPNEDTIQNQIRKNKTMNDNKIITTEDGEEINLARLNANSVAMILKDTPTMLLAKWN